MGNVRKNSKIRKEIAHTRRVLRATTSPKEQIAKLDARLGKGVGAVKERKRIKEKWPIELKKQ